MLYGTFPKLPSSVGEEKGGRQDKLNSQFPILSRTTSGLHQMQGPGLAIFRHGPPGYHRQG